MNENSSIDTSPQDKLSRLEADPEFEGGTFSMILATNPSGLEVKTDKSMPRHDEEFPYPLGPEEKARIKANYPGQMRFTTGNLAQEAQLKLRQLSPNASENEREAVKQDYEAKRKAYLERSPTEVGLRNVRRKGDIIVLDTRPVNFPVYRALGDSNLSKELLEFGATSATSVALVTADNRLLVTHRNPLNDPYGDMPGASAAGYFEGDFDKTTRTIRPITTASIKHNIVKEMEEELGLEESDLSELLLIGLALEKTQIHHEFLFYAKLNLTAEEAKTKATHERNLHPEEFAEKFTDIEASPETIFTLLTRLDAPMPPTHYGVFAAAGYQMVLQRDGITKANEYKALLEKGIQENNKRINKIVRDYYLANPQALTSLTARQEARLARAKNDFMAKNPQATDLEINNFTDQFVNNLPKRDPNGYNAYYLPTEQGLPDFTTAMRKAGLIA